MPSLSHGKVSPATRVVCIATAALLTLPPAASYAGPPEASAVAQVAALSVDSDPPGASVYVDGRFAGQTPLSVAKVTAGEHRVRLVKDGYIENGRIVSVSATQAHTIQVKLTRDPAASTSGGAGQVSGGGGGGSSKKWIIIGAAAGGGVLAAVLLANKNSAPTVSGVTATPNQGLASSTSVSFSAQASDPDGDTLSYNWNFGDGSTGTGASPTHTFASAGTFTVGVEVSDGKNTATGTTSVTIRSMAGAWTGTFSVFNFTMNLTQSGTTIGGTYSDADGPGTCSGTVSAGNAIRITVTQGAFLPFTFTGTTDNPVATATGSVTGLASAATFTMRR